MSNGYEEINSYSVDEIRSAISSNDLYLMREASLVASLLFKELTIAESLCRELFDHEDEQVRGNAVLGFGHLARRFGKLDKKTALPLIESALVDSSDYVRGQAWAAAEDVGHFLGWKPEGFVE